MTLPKSNMFDRNQGGLAPSTRKTLGLVSVFGTALYLCLSILSWVFSGELALVPFTSSSLPPMADLGIDSVHHYDLADYTGSARGQDRNERVLFLVPLRDAAAHLPMLFAHMDKMTYPHVLIDLAFLVSDSKDDTMGVLLKELNTLQSNRDVSKRFGSIEIFEKDFGQAVGQGFSDRHGFEAQGPRRKLMARARNWLLSVALRPDHSWVYWRDADVEKVPTTIMEDLMSHDKDVIVPNVWRPLPDWLGNEQPYDLNSWKESDAGLRLADTLDEDAVIVEGYAEYATWRPHLAYLRDPFGDIHVEMELDGIGGVSILAKAAVFRHGAHFPAFSFQKHAETEGFGKMCKRMGMSVVGLPHYTIWHIYEPSDDDLRHMEWMAQQDELREKERVLKEAHDKVWQSGFDNVKQEWERERELILKNVELDFDVHQKVRAKKAEEQSKAETKVHGPEEEKVVPGVGKAALQPDAVKKVVQG
ncbi:alpha-1,6 mannosyltransferase [Yarrowia lipolytica]|nr:Mannan polymerase II complex ANP1 subunit [Yarrowia lipolytica]RDW36635.1 alpha-1,6 mannosyltransferase [Yarrowia lipolytica]